MTMTAFPLAAEQVIELNDRANGLRGFIVIHSTALGPGAGGCRLWAYDSDAAALEDAQRLAKGMTFKNALAGLPFGGAKAVIRRPEGDFNREALFRAFGRAVQGLEGRYVTAEDVGTHVEDMHQISRETSFVAGLAKQGGRAGGDPSPWTALGIFEAMKHAARHAMNSDIAGLRVAVQGTGNVGAGLCALLAKAGAKLIVADLDGTRVERLRQAYGAEATDVETIAQVDADIFAPCALGGVLTGESVAHLSARMICGGANNQLARSNIAEALLDRGITYVPDYVANAGGIINVSAEYLGEDTAQVRDRVLAIGPRVARILHEAKQNRCSPVSVADNEAGRTVARANS